MAPNPLTNPELYDRCTLNGVLCPGLCKVEGASQPREWDKVLGLGQIGVATKLKQIGVAEFTLRVFLWEPKHFDDFEAKIRPILAVPKSRSNIRAIDIDTPELVKLDIKKVVVQNVAQLEETDPSGLYCYPISLLQFKKPRAIALLKASGQGDDPSKPAQPLDPQDIMIAQLSKQLKEEAAK